MQTTVLMHRQRQCLPPLFQTALPKCFITHMFYNNFPNVSHVFYCLDEMSAYKQPILSGKSNIFHRTKSQVRRRTFHLKNRLTTVASIWKYAGDNLEVVRK